MFRKWGLGFFTRIIRQGQILDGLSGQGGFRRRFEGMQDVVDLPRAGNAVKGQVATVAAMAGCRAGICMIDVPTFMVVVLASTQVAVAALVDPEWMVEIEAVAFVAE